MKIAEIHEMKSEEVHSELERLRRHLFDLRSQAVTEKLQDPTQMTKAKRDIARLLTALRQRGEKNVEQHQSQLEAIASHRGRR